MKDHLVKNEEIHSCYCGADLKDAQWRPEFSSHMFYRTVICNCGRKNMVKLGFGGSGHDRWKPTGAVKTTPDTFDEMVKKEHSKVAEKTGSAH